MTIDGKPVRRPSVGEWLNEPIIPAQIGKELRPALPIWALTWFLPCAVLAWFPDDEMARWELGTFLASALYAMGAAILGANAFGVEFTHRTIPLLLAQPASRRRLWATKMGILLVALLTSGLPIILCAQVLHAVDNDFLTAHFFGPDPRTILVLALVGASLNGFCAGPWLSMQARGVLSGSVFSLAVPTLLWLGAGLLAVGLRGVTWNADVRFVFWVAGLCVFWGASLVLGYQKFTRLEATDARRAEVSLPQWLLPVRRPSPTDGAPSRRWFWNLVKKELRLHQISLVLPLLFCGGSLIYALVTQEGVGNATPGFWWLGLLVYSVVTSLLIGALTCAEERQFGTLEWHMILPLRTGLQWGIKVAVAMSLSLLLGAVLPALLLWMPLFHALRQDLPNGTTALPFLTGLVTIVTSLAIYASSLSGTTVRAVLIALALALGCWVGLASSDLPLTSATGSLISAGLLIWFAFANYRRTGPRLTRVIGQTALAATCLGVIYAILVAL